MTVSASTVSLGHRKITWVGAGLMLLAFALPFIAAVAGYAVRPGSVWIGQTFGWLLGLTLVTWLVVRNRSKQAMANGFAVAAAALVLIVINGLSAEVRAGEAEKDFKRRATDLQASQQAQADALEKRIEAVDIAKVLNPESITSAVGLSAARATLAEYSSLLAERQSFRLTSLAVAEQFLQSGASLTSASQQHMAEVQARTDATRRIYADLGKAESNMVSAMSAVLDWGGANLGRLGARNGQLQFSARPQEARSQQEQLQVLTAAISDAEAKWNEALEASNDARAKTLGGQR